MLNQRLTKNIYLRVVPVCQTDEGPLITGSSEGPIIDYAVQMQRMDDEHHMAPMLGKGQVKPEHIRQIAPAGSAIFTNRGKDPPPRRLVLHPRGLLRHPEHGQLGGAQFRKRRRNCGHRPSFRRWAAFWSAWKGTSNTEKPPRIHGRRPRRPPFQEYFPARLPGAFRLHRIQRQFPATGRAGRGGLPVHGPELPPPPRPGRIPAFRRTPRETPRWKDRPIWPCSIIFSATGPM